MQQIRKKIYRAGVIPYYVKDGIIRMMFMKPSNKKHGGPDYQIAKGKLEPGEDYMTAGLREAHEELGLKQTNIAELHEMGVFMGRTAIYTAKIVDIADFDDTTDETEKTKWMTFHQFTSQGRALHKHVVRITYEFIKEIEHCE